MAVTSSSSFVGLTILLLISLGFIVLQVFLSRSKSKYLGLILPIISFVIGLVITISVFLYEGAIVGGAIIVFFLMQIPTIIYLVVYIIVRSTIKSKDTEKSELEKMSIQDL